MASAAQVSYGGEVTFAVTTTAAGVATPDAYVELRRTGPDGVPTVVDGATTDANGSVTLADAPTDRATYVAQAFSATDFAEGTSAPVGVEVAYAVTPTASPTAIPPGGRLSVTAEVMPAVAGGLVVVEERFGTGSWRAVSTATTAADGSVSVPLGKRSQVGTYTLRVSRPADVRYAAGAAEAVARVTVTGAGPTTAWRPIAGSRARPAHWGTCRIGYAVNPRRIPAHGISDLREALRRVTMVSGIRFRYTGPTGAVPYRGYGGPGVNRMVVAWAPPARTRGLLNPYVGGVGGTSRTGSGRIVSGYLLMNTQFAKRADAGFGSGSPHGMVLMHEIGHVVGLDHFTDLRQVMHPSATLPATVWGAGDLSGLRRIGKSGGCR